MTDSRANTRTASQGIGSVSRRRFLAGTGLAAGALMLSSMSTFASAAPAARSRTVTAFRLS